MSKTSLNPSKNVLTILEKEHELIEDHVVEDGRETFLLLECLENEDFPVLLAEAKNIPLGLKAHGHANFPGNTQQFLSISKSSKGIHNTLYFDYMWHEWDHSIPFLRYLDDFAKALTEADQRWDIRSNFDHHNSEIWIEIDSCIPENQPPWEFISEIFVTAERLSNQVCTNLRNAVVSDSLLVHFQIPEEFRSAAEQYLTYFVEFLVNVGLDSESAP